jgi:cytoskeleton protein RodZ
MNERFLPVSEDVVPAPDSMVHMSGGAMLRMAREAQGLHIDALAVGLKVPVAKLEALEADRFDLLPDTVFVRALAASICRTLKIDAAPILEQLPRTAAPLLKTDESGINTPFRPAGDGLGLSFWHQLSRPFVLAVLALLLGIAVLVFFPFRPQTEVASAPENASTDSVLPLSVPASSATEDSVPVEVAAPGSATNFALSGSEAVGAEDPNAVAASAALQGAASSPPIIVPGSGATTGLLIFKARGSSWIEVVDANRVVQVRKTLSDLEVAGVSGVLPLSVVVGRADATEVQVRGKPFDLTGIAKNNVARFEVK